MKLINVQLSARAPQKPSHSRRPGEAPRRAAVGAARAPPPPPEGVHTLGSPKAQGRMIPQAVAVGRDHLAEMDGGPQLAANPCYGGMGGQGENRSPSGPKPQKSDLCGSTKVAENHQLQQSLISIDALLLLQLLPLPPIREPQPITLHLLF